MINDLKYCIDKNSNQTFIYFNSQKGSFWWYFQTNILEKKDKYKPFQIINDNNKSGYVFSQIYFEDNLYKDRFYYDSIEITNLIDFDLSIFDLKISPSGKKLIYSYQDGGPLIIRVLDMETSNYKDFNLRKMYCLNAIGTDMIEFIDDNSITMSMYDDSWQDLGNKYYCNLYFLDINTMAIKKEIWIQ